MPIGHNVRLTTQAHRLCAEEAKEAKTSMKAVASEAIFLASHDKEKDAYEDEKYLQALQWERVRSKLEGELEGAKRRALRLLIAAAIAAGGLGIVIWAVI